MYTNFTTWANIVLRLAGTEAQDTGLGAWCQPYFCARGAALAGAGGEGGCLDSLGAVECVVVGAGVVGLACARALADSGREVLVLEAERRIGEHGSARNSEVIHAGMVYPPGSLKARLCVEGRALLYDYLGRRGIAHRRLGKLIVATSPAQLPALRRLQAWGRASGVDDLQLLEAAELARLEPSLRGVGALLSPATGIFDSHAYLLALRADVESAGGTLAFGARAVGGRLSTAGFELDVAQQGRRFQLGCRWLVNAAGLGAQRLARAISGFPGHNIPPAYYARGRYMTYSASVPFKRLIYPMPQAAGLGIHLTLDMAGQARFGPDVQWVDAPAYDFPKGLRSGFARAIRDYWPEVDALRLQPGYVGVRPKLAGPGEAAADFDIQGPTQHGIAGLVHFFGIESPGLTASLALGAYARNCLETTHANK